MKYAAVIVTTHLAMDATQRHLQVLGTLSMNDIASLNVSKNFSMVLNIC
jgi:hypothetical protein